MTDEEKAQKLSEGVETPKSEDEPDTEQEQSTEEATDESREEEQNSESTEEAEDSQESTFTKQYANLRGDTPEEYAKSLEEAYQNSTAEAIRLKKQLDENSQLVERAKAMLEGETKDDDKAAFDINALPEIQMLRAEQQSKMVEAFETFSKKYPQARETEGFDAFQKASNGVSQAFLAANGRVPTYNELFETTAKVLNWSPSDKSARKDAAIKEAGSSGNTTTGSSKLPQKTAITAEQLKVARAMLKPDVSAKTSDADLIKDLEKQL